MINGGGEPDRNYQSHLLHVRELIALLVDRGVAADDIAVFASDGDEPKPDLAVLDERTEKHFWLIENLAVGAKLRPAVRLVSSEIDGVRLRPASRAAISSWFEEEARKLGEGDRLLIYVTDHGRKNKSDLRNNSIVLWGEDLSVTDLKRLLAKLPAGVRTVMLMSQCFSGSFAHAIFGDTASPRSIDDKICGYFSSSADRFAYGCYPENLGKRNVGHSFHFIDAVRVLGSFPRAHDRVQLTDRTPDVPNRTSDHYLQWLVRAHAGSASVSYDAFADELLGQAWSDELHYRYALEQLDQLGEVFGAFGPRTFAELRERTANLPDLRHDLRRYARSWGGALLDVKQENFDRFIAVQPEWGARVGSDVIEDLEPPELRTLRRILLDDLWAFTMADPLVRKRLKLLRTMSREAAAAAYRMEVRLAVALRMREVLGRIAGEVFLDHYANHAERAAYEGLVACEDFALEPAAPVLARLDLGPSYPPLDEELRLLASVLPGWLGIQFRPLDGDRRALLGLERGAVSVLLVYPHSPAAEAGIVADDIVLGPPGGHFTERNQIREWVMTSLADREQRLDVLRGDRIVTFPIRIGQPPVDPQ